MRRWVVFGAGAEAVGAAACGAGAWAVSVVLLGVWGGAAWGEAVQGTVVSVGAGDLLSVKVGEQTEEMRLFAVDCPEAGQAYFEEAKAFAVEKTKGVAVLVETVARATDGRPVATLGLTDGVTLNQALVEAGLAWWDMNNAPKAGAYSAANAKAIGAKAGLFSDAAALAPWDYRRSKGLPDFSYSVSPEPAAAAAAAAPPEVKSLSAKGSGYLPAEEQGTVDITNIQMDEPPNVAELMGRHQPRIVTDSSGSAMGLTATDIGNIPFASQLGFQEGDILSSVNGQRLTDFGRIGQLVSEFRDMKSFQVEVLRNGKPVRWTINVP